MTPKQIISVIEMYEERLVAAGVPKIRMDPKRTFRSTTVAERLAHAHYLCAGVKKYVREPEKQRKTGSHLTAVQMCLSFAGWYTLEELMQHNRSPAENLKAATAAQTYSRKLLNVSIDILGLSVRTANCLRADNKLRVGDIVKLFKTDLAAIPGVTPKMVQEVEKALAAKDLYLSG